MLVKFRWVSSETWPTITECELGHGPTEGAKIESQESSKGVADPQIEFDAS
jgi:hypothetical protein